MRILEPILTRRRTTGATLMSSSTSGSAPFAGSGGRGGRRVCEEKPTCGSRHGVLLSPRAFPRARHRR
jgi:hypothetical protein